MNDLDAKWATFGIADTDAPHVTVGTLCEVMHAGDMESALRGATARTLGRGTASQCRDLDMLTEAWDVALANYDMQLEVTSNRASIVEVGQ